MRLIASAMRQPHGDDQHDEVGHPRPRARSPTTSTRTGCSRSRPEQQQREPERRGAARRPRHRRSTAGALERLDRLLEGVRLDELDDPGDRVGVGRAIVAARASSASGRHPGGSRPRPPRLQSGAPPRRKRSMASTSSSAASSTSRRRRRRAPAGAGSGRRDRTAPARPGGSSATSGSSLIIAVVDVGRRPRRAAGQPRGRPGAATSASSTRPRSPGVRRRSSSGQSSTSAIGYGSSGQPGVDRIRPSPDRTTRSGRRRAASTAPSEPPCRRRERSSPPPTSRPRSISATPNSGSPVSSARQSMHELAVARLEHVQRQHRPGQQHGAQREHRHHGDAATVRGVCAPGVAARQPAHKRRVTGVRARPATGPTGRSRAPSASGPRSGGRRSGRSACPGR